MKVKDIGTVSAVGATGALDISKDIDGYTSYAFGVQCTAVGDPLTITVDLEGSFDGVNWAPLETHVFTAEELVSKVAIFHSLSKPVLHLRANVTTLTYTTSCDVQTSILYGK